MSGLCRDCGASVGPAGGRCGACYGRRVVHHPELKSLSIAHIDCDAFYASIEKRDDPSLADKPVIVGGGRRGVVSAACYISRTYGIRSAMPMFKALKACPDAVVIRPNMTKYAAAGREIRALMLDTTPLVEPLSIDEAFLDLSGTERLHGAAPAETLIRLIRRIETDIGVTASVGLSYNKFLAKTASDLDKPRGFAVIGQADALDFLAPRAVGTIYGVGPALQKRLAADGIRTIGQIRGMEEEILLRRYGAIGRRLSRFAHGQDTRLVQPGEGAKSVSSETTFNEDLQGADALLPKLWRLSEKVAARVKAKHIAGKTVTLKLKTSAFQTITRARTLPAPTQLAEVIYRQGAQLLDEALRENRERSFRLIGVGLSHLGDDTEADPPDLLDPEAAKRAKVEAAIDSVRGKLGEAAVVKGRGFRRKRVPDD